MTASIPGRDGDQPVPQAIYTSFGQAAIRADRPQGRTAMPDPDACCWSRSRQPSLPAPPASKTCALPVPLPSTPGRRRRHRLRRFAMACSAHR